MNKREKLGLQSSVQGNYRDLECRQIVPIQFPCWKYEANILISAESGPEALDRIFMGLIKNSVDTKAELAQALGVDKDEFIFQHLNVLVDREYISISKKGTYELTQLGNDFDYGQYFEKRIQEQKLSFIWDCASKDLSDSFKEIVFKKNIKKNSAAKLLKFPDPPSENDIKGKLPYYFNEQPENEGQAFYGFPALKYYQKWLSWENSYWQQQFAALFYVAKGRDASDEIKHIEIRQRIDPKRPEFELREDLTEIIKSQKIPQWNKQLENFYEKEPKLQ